MVRLKDRLSFGIAYVTLFQFHYGTIKRILEHSITGKVIYFNSTMVRLKENQSVVPARVASVFQFHYGTIKSKRVRDFSPIELLFQFHYGTIKS